MRILIAEDEPDMAKIIRLYLERAGYEVYTACDGSEAFEMVCREPFDLVIVDWMMPKKSGIWLCETIRSHGLPVKIILLTAKSSVEHEIAGLSSGADDYIRKPFQPKILLLRVEKLLGTDEVLRCGHLSLNLKTQAASVGESPVRLTAKEYQLLRLFMENQGVILTREVLLDRVWGGEYEGDERTLDTHIRRLRGKIGREYITTHIGMGYRMDKRHE